MTQEHSAPRHFPDIESERLWLRWASPAAIQASLDGRVEDAAAELGCLLPEDWPEPHLRRVMVMRLHQIESEPASAEWLLRCMIRRSDGVVLGYINFHGTPDEQGRAELGYTVFEAYRRQGYAAEASLAMMDWAHRTHGTTTFVLSISPSNPPSLRMANALGFERVGTHFDDIDGEEWVFKRQWSAQ